MATKKMYALSITDDTRLDELVGIANAELEKSGLKKANRTTILRALVFSGTKMKLEDLIDGLNKARTHA